MDQIKVRALVKTRIAMDRHCKKRASVLSLFTCSDEELGFKAIQSIIRKEFEKIATPSYMDENDRIITYYVVDMTLSKDDDKWCTVENITWDGTSYEVTENAILNDYMGYMDCEGCEYEEICKGKNNPENDPEYGSCTTCLHYKDYNYCTRCEDDSEYEYCK